MLVSATELMQDAQKNKYAVPAINTQGGSYDIIRAMMEAAEEAGSPMMIAMYVNNVHYYGMDWFANVSKTLGSQVKVPVAIHLDHGDTFENCCKAVKCGFTSVMLDCSHDSIEENARKTNEVIRMAHACGVSVEAEVGELQRLDAEGGCGDNQNIANLADVQKFVDNSQPDMLAIGIGNAHGFYKGEPNIRLDVLEQVREITDIPLVLHGCTGMDEDIVRKSIQMGICKINFGTLIRHKYMEYYKEGIDTLKHNAHSWMVAKYAMEKLKVNIKDIIDLSSSANRY